MKKIEYAVGAAGVFIRHMHRENFDRGMIATFGNTYRVDQGFTSDEFQLHQALSRLSRAYLNEGTRLYDSIEDVVNEFWRNGRRDRPWVLIIVTDGMDNESTRYRNDPKGVGRYVATRYNHEPSNFVFLIGVGKGKEIDKQALGQVADSGDFLGVTIEAFPLLELIFLQIAVKVSSGLVGRTIDMGSLSWTQVAEIRRLSHTAVDYAFLIDRSGSMSESGD